MSLVFNRDNYDLPMLLFEQHAVDRGYTSWRHATWHTDVEHMDGLADAAFRYAGSDGERSARLDRASALAFVTLDRHGRVATWIAAESDAAVLKILGEIREALSPASDDEPGEVSVLFWTSGPHHPRSVSRKVAVEPWAEIRGNYASDVAHMLDTLTARKAPPPGGQLVLWHGPPGTGKTHAIRALIREWRGWARPEYVVDPEAFFGSSASYIMSVLLGDEDDDDVDEAMWRLLIFEDTGELLSADAKDRTGQGLSRLLNTVDGLLGQGLRVLVLITTNEDLGRLHPAVSRPGRASVNLRFGPLGIEQAREWLVRRGGTPPTELRDTTLAELFALLEGRDAQMASVRSIGFGSRH